MNPAIGSKSSKGRKKGVSICPRVMTFFQEADSISKQQRCDIFTMPFLLDLFCALLVYFECHV